MITKAKLVVPCTKMGAVCPVSHPKFGTTGGLMAIPLGVYPNGTTSGFHVKNTHLCTYFMEKKHAVSAVFIDNAKLFSQLMSKSRNLAEISEKRLQPLLVNLRN